MLDPKSLHDPSPSPSVRTLKIEEDGDPWKGAIKPKIRLVGRWLERAGFTPGHRVRVVCVSPGVIELQSAEASPARHQNRPSPEQGEDLP